jgi:hypothetical protein
MVDQPRAVGVVVSHTPGRVRVRLRPDQVPDFQRIQQRLLRQPGVRSTEVNPRTGSVLIAFDTEQATWDQVSGAFSDEGIALRDRSEVAEAVVGHSTTAARLMSAVGDLDRRISSMSSQRLDLKLLFPAILCLIGLRQSFTQGLGLGQVPGYVLLWYAFDAFWKMHADSRRAEPPE